jgi:hypothetical protein
VIEFNVFLERGAIELDPETARLRIDYAKMVEAVEFLARELLTVQGEGDYEKARALLARYGGTPKALRTVTPRLSGIPVDIRPRFAVLREPLVAARP